MTTVSIGGDKRSLADAPIPWIRDAVRALESRGLEVCAEVSIQSGAINITLSTPACAHAGSPGFQPNNEEQRIVDLWRKRGLSEVGWNVGELIAFLNEIKHLK